MEKVVYNQIMDKNYIGIVTVLDYETIVMLNERERCIKRMTNREWLKSLTDNELAEIFCDNDLGNICNICAYRNDRKGCMNVTCCEYGASEWLKQEHKDDEQKIRN